VKGAVKGADLPAAWFVTDPERTPDPVATAAQLARGCGVIFRGFGRPDAEATAARLAALARRRGLLLLIGADEALAAGVGAGGVHLPERDLWKAPRIRARHPGWIITGAAHSPLALQHARRAGLDAVLLSAVFPSHSPSAGKPIGTIKFALAVLGSRTPTIALGGVNARTAGRLVGTNAQGFAAVEGWL
jgi:thiamine-phosphate pyrophosphorylase